MNSQSKTTHTAPNTVEADGFRFVRELDGIREYELLTNGLRVLLAEDHSAPVATVVLTYQVGSRNETDRYRGAAHLLEHMMFKGTPTYNKDKNTTISKVLQNTGALINAGTWNDGTNYYELIPADHIPLALDIEADRMRNSFIREEDLKAEMPVVQSEFDRMDNSPVIALYHAVWAEAYRIHPYHFPVIGIREDLYKMPASHLKEFYDAYYWPNNSILAVIGDISPAAVLREIHNKFSKLPRSSQPIPKMTTSEPEQKEKRFAKVEREDKLQAVLTAHKIPAADHPDIPVLDVAAQILGGGKTSRLYRKLIDTGIAVEIQTAAEKMHDPGIFATTGVLSSGQNHEAIEKIILESYDELRRNSPTETEIIRAQNQLHANQAYKRDGSFSIANELSGAISYGDWTTFATYLDKVAAVKPADIQRVAAQYFRTETLTTGFLISKNAQAGAEEALTRQDKEPPLRSDPMQGEGEKYAPTVSRLSGKLNPKAPVSPKAASAPAKKLSERVQVKTSGPIKTLCMPTAAEDVVSIMGSFEGAGQRYSENSMLPSFTASLLEQGTEKRDKFAIAALLEDRGAQISFRINHERVGFEARCLRQDLGIVVDLIAEQLRIPAFSAEELEKLKQRQLVSIHEAINDTGSQAEAHLARAIYPVNHPHYEKTFEDQLKDLEALRLDDIKKFHQDHYGPQNMIIAAAGDVGMDEFQASVEKAFGGWKTLAPVHAADMKVAVASSPVRETVVVPDKTMVDVTMGHALPIVRNSPEFLPLFVVNAILGGDFSARLASTVRDNEGLTYHIQSELSGIEKEIQGHWQISMILNNQSLEAGIESSLKQIRLFTEKGISEQELEEKKNTLIGNFKVSLSTTRGTAQQILRTEELGLGIRYLDEFPEKLKVISVAEANQLIRKFFDPDKLALVVAGSVGDKKQP